MLFRSGVSGGSNSHTITSAELPTHTHSINHDHASFSSGSQSANHTHNTVMGNHKHDRLYTQDAGTVTHSGDWYAYNYYDTSALEPYNPKGPRQGVYRVLRGGCWKSLKEDLRCSQRHRNNPGTVNGTYGFRCATDVS